ncbi:MAG: hypothetical protein JO353_08315 [Phycisphaerae bacterium]|nr:hypothetical protein [Phycisphaerae bacterium]
MLSKEQLVKPKIERVTISEGEIDLRVLRLAEINKWSADTKDKPIVARSTMLSLCICDEDGKRIFADANAAGEISFPVANEIFDHCLAINKLGKKSDAATDVKTEGATPTGS